VGSAPPPADDPAPADGDDAPLDSDDPCATADPPTGCPIGVTGIVLVDTVIPAETRLYVHPDPIRDIGSTVFHCDAMPDGDPAPGTIWISVGTTVPAEGTLTYSPVGDPADERTVEWTTSDADRAAWDADYATRHAYREGYWFFNNCVELTGLDSGDYSVTVNGTDIFGRIPAPVTTTFSGEGQPVVPPMNVVPLGGALLYVSVPSPFAADAPRDRPIIRAWVVGPDEGNACDGFEDHAELTSLQGQQTYAVEPSWLDARNYRPEYTSRDVEIYSVPEGSQIVVCARWYSRPEHSWENWIEAQRMLPVSSPDIVTPTISIESVQLGRTVQPGDLRVSASMPGGIPCGDRWSDTENVLGPGNVDVGIQLCDAVTVGFDGRVVISTGLDLGDEDWADTSSVLQLSRTRCAGVCPVPAPSHYIVNLATQRTGSSLCSGEGCTPPTESSSAGRVVLAVTWNQGNVNGAERWSIGGTDSSVPGDTESEAPQLDTNQFAEGGHSSDGWTGTVQAPIVVDRDAHYRATLSGTCFPDGYVNTPQVGTVRPSTGASASWSGLCPAGSYFVTIELWDDAGHRSTYSYSGATWWPGSLAQIFNAPLDVSTMIFAGPRNAQHVRYGLPYFEVSINGNPATRSAGEELCIPADDAFLDPANGTALASQTREYTVTVTSHVFMQDTGFSPTGGPESQCGFERVRNGTTVFTGTFTYDQLMSSRGVRLSGVGTWAPESIGVFGYSSLLDWTVDITLNGTRP
jgi:hypothetical protein